MLRILGKDEAGRTVYAVMQCRVLTFLGIAWCREHGVIHANGSSGTCRVRDAFMDALAVMQGRRPGTGLAVVAGEDE